MRELTALLAFKAIDVPKGSKKPVLRDLAQNAMQLDDVPMLALPPPPNTHSVEQDDVQEPTEAQHESDLESDGERSDFSDGDE